MKKALEKLVLLDLTHMLSGPYGVLLLADMGIDVIKVEPLEGEGTRKLLADDPKHSSNGMGAYFLSLNRNKRSVCIDLKSESGKDIFYKLVEKADVVFDNFGVGVTKRLKINHEVLSAINPRIITCSVTGFGETGPCANFPAYDQVVQGMGGGMSITGFAGGLPVRSGIPIGDLGGGIFGALGTLAALQARNTTGRGQHVDISMLDGQISLLNYMATMCLLSGEDPGPMGNSHFVHVPYDVFRTKTEPIIIAVVGDIFWVNLIKVLQAPELDDIKFATQPERLKEKKAINDKIEEVLLTETADYWLSKLSEARIPCSPVYRLSQALSDAQVLSRNMVVEVEQVSGPRVKMPGNPVKLSDTYADVYSPPPTLGQHTTEVLSNMLNYNENKIEELRMMKVIA